MNKALQAWRELADRDVAWDAERYVDSTPALRLRHLAMVCKAAMDSLAFHSNKKRALAYRDSLPPSTLAAWRRMSQ